MIFDRDPREWPHTPVAGHHPVVQHGTKDETQSKVLPDATSQISRSQVAGTHYTRLQIQPWDYVYQNGLGYFEGSIIKYISRWRSKGGLEDLHKCKHFLERLIELEEQQNAK